MFKFTAPKQQGPAYTLRMLLGTINSPIDAESPKLKPFAHFTLACTSADETEKVSKAVANVIEYLGKPLSLKGEAVLNFGTKERPLWVIKLNLGEQEKALREVLGKSFDSIMCPEQSGVCYQWTPNADNSEKCPHITVGTKDEDELLATKLVNDSCEFVFDQIDYKKVGPHDPHVSYALRPQQAAAASVSCAP
ncbi:MAG: hypothetical protein ACHP65_06065 [Legionellales bacterium]